MVNVVGMVSMVSVVSMVSTLLLAAQAMPPPQVIEPADAFGASAEAVRLRKGGAAASACKPRSLSVTGPV